MPGRRCHAACMVGKFMFLIGGINQAGKFLNDLYLLDIVTQRWIEQSTVTALN